MRGQLGMGVQSSGVQDSGAASTAVATKRNGLLWPKRGSLWKMGIQYKAAVLLPELIEVCSAGRGPPAA